MNKYLLAGLFFLSFFSGIIFFLVNSGILFINLPKAFFNKKNLVHSSVIGSKKISYFYYKQDKLEVINEEILWTSLSKADQYKMLVAGWLQHAKDELLIDQGVWIDLAALSGLENELYLSFNRSFLAEEMPLAMRWRLVEALLKTCKQGSCPIERVYFLVNHQPMLDYQLDFAEPITINGFLS